MAVLVQTRSAWASIWYGVDNTMTAATTATAPMTNGTRMWRGSTSLPAANGDSLEPRNRTNPRREATDRSAGGHHHSASVVSVLLIRAVITAGITGVRLSATSR